MSIRKETAVGAGPPKETPEHLKKAFEEALSEFAAALKLLREANFDSARSAFVKIISERQDEPSLVERARTYVRLCDRKLSPVAATPTSADDLFYHAVLHINNGEADDALRLIDQALSLEPESPRLLYARASAGAIKGEADAAVTDLRRAIAADPQVRFQAGNDPDFEKIREEPAFIDIIEPTPTGA